MPEHPLNGLEFAPALTATLAAVCRRSCGVIVGNVASPALALLDGCREEALSVVRYPQHIASCSVALKVGRRVILDASKHRGGLRDVLLFICAILFTGIWWSADHHRSIWLPMFIVFILVAVWSAGYALRGVHRSTINLIRRDDRPSAPPVVRGPDQLSDAETVDPVPTLSAEAAAAPTELMGLRPFTS